MVSFYNRNLCSTIVGENLRAAFRTKRDRLFVILMRVVGGGY